MSQQPKPISLQLYTLREAAAKDFPSVLRRVAEMGYKGVEPAGFFNFTPRDFRKFTEDLGMVVSSTHSPWVREDNISEVVDAAGELGVTFVVAGWGAQDFADGEAIRRTADRAAKIHSALATAGLTLAIHNHAWEFEKLDGRIKHEIFAELCPAVSFELDTYWAANYGENSAPEMMRRFAARSPLLHIKDGPLTRPVTALNEKTGDIEIVPGSPSAAMLAVGSGKNDIRGIIAAMDPEVTQWLVVELDTSDTDMFECVEASYRFLTENGLAAGNR